MADPSSTVAPATAAETNGSFMDTISGIFTEMYSSPINLALLAVSAYLVYKLVKDRFAKEEPKFRPLARMEKRDFTLEELRVYDGTANAPEGRILMAVDGKVFDVTRGRGFYGPGGPYGIFAGRDASRGLGTYLLDESVIKDTHDDLSDLTADQLNTMREWAENFTEKYHLVGRLLRPGETHKNYSTPEEETKEDSSETTVKEAGSD